MKRNKRTKLALQPETIRHLAGAVLRKAMGGVITDMDTLLNCYTECMCGPCPTDAAPCMSNAVCDTNFASCQSNYMGCPVDTLVGC